MSKSINLVKDGVFPIMYDIDGNTIKKDLDTGFNCGSTIQGEGKEVGMPCFFIRTSGCNLRCFVLQPGRGIPMIYYPDGTRRKMTEVKEGDTILAYNEETKQLDETTVTEIIKNSTTEWVQITVERLGTFNLTLEHPLLITTGWITAGELKEGDELLHISGTERNSYRMKKNNPLKNKETSAKMHSNQNYKDTRKSSGEPKVIESAIQCYFRPDLAKYTEETIDFYERNGYEVLVLNGDLSKEEQSTQLLNFVHNGLKVKKIKQFSDLTYYKNSKPEIRSYPTINLHCYPYNNYLVGLGNFTQSIISHNCTFSNKDGKTTNLCDTSYSSFNPENNKMKVEDVVALMEVNLTHSHTRHVVITGGEPMCQQEALIDLCRELKVLGVHITLETNGTIFNKEVAKYIDLFSISPKLSNSNPTEEKLRNLEGFYVSDNLMDQHKNRRKNLVVLQKFIDSCWEFKFGDERGERLRTPDFQLKFVVTDEEDLLEINDEYLHYLEGWETSDILLMPEGITTQELKERSMWLAEQCIRNGYRYCPRLQVELFGKSRSV